MKAWNKKHKPKHPTKVKLFKKTSRGYFLGGGETKFYCRIMRNKLKKSKIFWLGKRLGGKGKRTRAIQIIKVSKRRNYGETKHS